MSDLHLFGWQRCSTWLACPSPCPSGRRSEAGKWRAVVQEIKRMHKTGRPVLVGTTSVEKSEALAGMLEEEGIAYQARGAGRQGGVARRGGGAAASPSRHPRLPAACRWKRGRLLPSRLLWQWLAAARPLLCLSSMPACCVRAACLTPGCRGG